MADAEVARLRRLRASALRVRAVARALERSRSLPFEPVLPRGACAAWRIARAVSGRLRAHPHANYQQDAGLAVVLKSGVSAAAAALGARSRQAALLRFEAQVRRLARELDDARALTWSADLSEALGRSQVEVRTLIEELSRETRGSRATPLPPAAPAQHAEGHSPYLAL
jgi:hypothetical protein